MQQCQSFSHLAYLAWTISYRKEGHPSHLPADVFKCLSGAADGARKRPSKAYAAYAAAVVGFLCGRAGMPFDSHSI
ncbi:hypothetical protein K458DRAFT_163690 [Lentithecium fluviatile CBS 122367]|uniref:Uncharacterized protein n=1 Tax=Lentithecium fluviatile CBS 122367 TaxID=1168545 RepID=A0A6G1IGF6_9PLEO|nr:hypothetical protein K458DRAFT_163690 [Lentithecium fluviatile CBS 122367]